MNYKRIAEFEPHARRVALTEDDAAFVGEMAKSRLTRMAVEQMRPGDIVAQAQAMMETTDNAGLRKRIEWALGRYFRSHVVQNSNGLVNLTELWRAAGSKDTARPSDWLQQDQTKAFLDHLSGGNDPAQTGLINATRGRSGGTWGHWQIALMYAQYLSPEFRQWSNTILQKAISEQGIDLDSNLARSVGRQVGRIVPDDRTSTWH